MRLTRATSGGSSTLIGLRGFTWAWSCRRTNSTQRRTSRVARGRRRDWRVSSITWDRRCGSATWMCFFGTLERGNPKLLETVMADKAAAPFIKGVGVQWAGKNALPALHREFPDLPILSVGTGVRRWEERVELHRLLLATDEALFSQRGVRLYVLEHLDRRSGRARGDGSRIRW